MTEQPEINLEPHAFRPVVDRPLAKPRDLKIGLVVFAVGSVLGAVAAWRIGGFWAALLPIPCAVMAGVAWAGLDPGHWFRAPPRDI